MSAAELTGYCPLCDNDPAEILNVGREHYAVCHECKAYWHIGSNLFSGWRDEEPEVWERNKKLLATYKNASAAEAERAAQYIGYLESLPFNEVANAPTMAEYFNDNAPTKTVNLPRPPLASLGDCLEETASYQPQGFTKITGCTESFWRSLPVDQPDTPWFAMEAATACLEPAPVHIFIKAGTPAKTAREILKQVSKWLKEHGEELPSLTPREPEPTACDLDSIPF